MGQIIDMQQQTEQDELIQRYLTKRMSAAEVAEFEEKIRTDVQFKRHARFVAQTIKALREMEKEEEVGIPLRPVACTARRVAKNPVPRSGE